MLNNNTLMTPGFVVATDDPGHPGVTLFMVDRRVQKKSFWSNRLSDVFVYLDRDAAEIKAKSLKLNNPRVLTWIEARSAMSSVVN